MRITMSVALPAPNGTSTLIGLDGNFSCAGTAVTPNAKPDTKPAATSRNTRDTFITTPSLVIQVDLDLFCDFLPRRDFAVQPGLRVAERRGGIAADFLLRIGFEHEIGFQRLQHRLLQGVEHPGR